VAKKTFSGAFQPTRRQEWKRTKERYEVSPRLKPLPHEQEPVRGDLGPWGILLAVPFQDIHVPGIFQQL
jgi:hypothetical protein